MNSKLLSSFSVISFSYILIMSLTTANSAYGVTTPSDQMTNTPQIDFKQSVKVLTLSGKDQSGNNFQIELILNKDLMEMHHMMMSMSDMMNMMGMSGMTMQPGNMEGMSGNMSGKSGMTMQPGNMEGMSGMNKQSQYLVEAGIITIGSSAYPIDSGDARIVDDKVFLNTHAGSFKAGKVVLYGKLNQDGGLKGFLLLSETKTFVKISGNGNIADAFQ